MTRPPVAVSCGEPSGIGPEIAVAAWTPIYGWYRQALGDELFAAAFPNWPEQKGRREKGACHKTFHRLLPRSDGAK